MHVVVNKVVYGVDYSIIQMIQLFKWLQHLTSKRKDKRNSEIFSEGHLEKFPLNFPREHQRRIQNSVKRLKLRFLQK